VAADPNVANWDAATMDEIYAAIMGDPRWMSDDGSVRRSAQLLELTSDGDVSVVEEARRLLSRMCKPLH
jgi:hypothetical protein